MLMPDKATQKIENSLKEAKESEIHLIPELAIPQKHQADSHNIHRGPGVAPRRPLSFHFNLCECIWVMLSWFSELCSSLVLCPLWLLHSFLPCLTWFPDLQGLLILYTISVYTLKTRERESWSPGSQNRVTKAYTYFLSCLNDVRGQWWQNM